MADETPIEEWRVNAKGKRYTVVKGPGGGTIFQRGDETIDQARLRHATDQEAKRRGQRTEAAAPGAPKRPKGKGRAPDQPPRVAAGSEKVKPAKQRPSTDQLAAAAELPLSVIGAFVGRGILGCEFCADSMRVNAPLAAKDLAKTTNPYLLNLLTWWHGLVASLAGGDGLVMFIAPPLVHHALPEPAFSFVAPFLRVPPKQARQAHQHGPQGRPAPMSAPPGNTGAATGPPPVPPPGAGRPFTGPGGRPITPQEADLLARGINPWTQPQPTSAPPTGGQGAPTGQPPPALTPEQAAEYAALQAERARLQAIAQMGQRQAQAAAEMNANGGGARVPTYRAPDTMSPTQLRQVQAAAESAGLGGAIPNYSHGDHAPGTPTPPGADPAESAGSPLPPEA